MKFRPHQTVAMLARMAALLVSVQGGENRVDLADFIGDFTRQPCCVAFVHALGCEDFELGVDRIQAPTACSRRSSARSVRFSNFSIVWSW